MPASQENHFSKEKWSFLTMFNTVTFSNTVNPPNFLENIGVDERTYTNVHSCTRVCRI